MLRNGFDIKKYSFEDILRLFRLQKNYTADDLRRIKSKIIELSPQKSNMPPEYISFYKDAFNILLQNYDIYKQTMESYTINNNLSVVSSQTIFVEPPHNPKIESKIKEFKIKDFQLLFNELFEKYIWKPPNNCHDNYRWFSDLNKVYAGATHILFNEINIYDKLEKVKIEQRKHIIPSNGEEPIETTIYSFLLPDTKEGYIFSPWKNILQYYDIRKVHKNETVYNIRDNDYLNRKIYSLEDYVNIRSREDSQIMQVTIAKNILRKQKEIEKMKYIDRNRDIKINTETYMKSQTNAILDFLSTNVIEWHEMIIREEERERKKQELLHLRSKSTYINCK